jgi:hypothetical protein
MTEVSAEEVAKTRKTRADEWMENSTKGLTKLKMAAMWMLRMDRLVFLAIWRKLDL